VFSWEISMPVNPNSVHIFLTIVWWCRKLDGCAGLWGGAAAAAAEDSGHARVEAGGRPAKWSCHLGGSWDVI
jgi:hypothetical protein